MLLDENSCEEPAGYSISCNFVECINNREMGCDRRFQQMRLTSEYATRHMLSNAMLKEYQISQANTNKVFCSQWLSHKQVIFGTKCNKLMVLDVNTKHLDQIPSLASSENSNPPDQECGIHSIEMNPSRTLLATGARNSNDVAGRETGWNPLRASQTLGRLTFMFQSIVFLPSTPSVSEKMPIPTGYLTR